MANKRDLKKNINYICSELFAECVANSLYNGKFDDKNTEALLHSILSIHSNYIRRVSHPEPGMAAKKYYADLISGFNEQINETIDQITNQE